MSINPVIKAVLEKEGNYVNHPNDPGGATRWGITEKTARDFGYNGEMKNFSREDAYTILEKNYWYLPGFNKIEKLSPVLALELCDTGTNMGPAVGIKWLQRWLNAYNNMGAYYADIVVDGNIGPATLNALNAFLQKRGKEGERVMLVSLNCSQGQRYLELSEKNSTNESFVYGWIKERINFTAP